MLGRYRNERERRAACLHALVIDAAQRSDAMLVLEQDDTLLSFDNQRLIEFTRAAGCRDTLRYEHQRAASEPLLAVPDAVAWCWAKGGDWRRRIEPIVTDVHVVWTGPKQARSPSATVVRPGLGLTS